MPFEEVSDTSLLFDLMKIRNNVRSFMTGSQDEITEEQQIEWFSNLDHSLTKIWLYGDKPNEWLGYGQLKIEPGHITYGVSTHAVVETSRGKGYGKKILLYIIEQAREYGCNAMRAEIFKNNHASLGLVYKLGYVNTLDIGDTFEVQLPL